MDMAVVAVGGDDDDVERHICIRDDRLRLYELDLV
jgi:hypothetical protein